MDPKKRNPDSVTRASVTHGGSPKLSKVGSQAVKKGDHFIRVVSRTQVVATRSGAVLATAPAAPLVIYGEVDYVDAATGAIHGWCFSDEDREGSYVTTPARKITEWVSATYFTMARRMQWPNAMGPARLRVVSCSANANCVPTPPISSAAANTNAVPAASETSKKAPPYVDPIADRMVAYRLRGAERGVRLDDELSKAVESMGPSEDEREVDLMRAAHLLGPRVEAIHPDARALAALAEIVLDAPVVLPGSFDEPFVFSTGMDGVAIVPYPHGEDCEVFLDPVTAAHADGARGAGMAVRLVLAWHGGVVAGWSAITAADLPGVLARNDVLALAVKLAMLPRSAVKVRSRRKKAAAQVKPVDKPTGAPAGWTIRHVSIKGDLRGAIHREPRTAGGRGLDKTKLVRKLISVPAREAWRACGNDHKERRRVTVSAHEKWVWVRPNVVKRVHA